MDKERKMRWIVLSTFTRAKDPEWIFEFVDRNIHSVEAVPSTYNHDRSRKSSSISNWLDYFSHALRGIAKTFFTTKRIGIITVFPQLALITALLKKITGRKNLVLIAWMFNLARPYDGIKGKLAKFCMSSVDMFVVHSNDEIEIYSKWLGLPQSKFTFVHLSAEPPKHAPWQEQSADPYIVALGTANRDYGLLTDAVRDLGYKTIIVSGKYAIEHITPPDCVSFKSGLSLSECHELATHARLNVIPIADISSASGQVTVIESMMLGVPLVVTECAGTVDYIVNDVDGVFVKPKDVNSMKAALEKVWRDAELRARLSENAKKTARDKFSFEAASKTLIRLMDDFAGQETRY